MIGQPLSSVSESPQTGDRLIRAAGAMLECIPPMRPIDVVVAGILHDELVNPSIDFLGVAGLLRSSSLPRLNDEEIEEIINTLKTVKSDLPLLASGENVMHDPTLWRIKGAFGEGEESGNAHNNIQIMKEEAALPQAADDEVSSVMSAASSIQSAIGRIESLTGRLGSSVGRSLAKKNRKKSRLRIDRQINSADDVLIDTFDCIMNRRDLSTEQQLALREILDTGCSPDHIQHAFTIICLWSDLFDSANEPNGFISLAFTLCALSYFLEGKRENAVLPFDLNSFLLRAVRQLHLFDEGKLFELKHVLMSLSCLFSKTNVDESVLSAYLNAVLNLIKIKELRKSMYSHLKNLIISCFRAASDSLKKQALVDILESFLCNQQDMIRLSVDVLVALIVRLGMKDKQEIQQTLIKSMSDYIWTNIADSKVNGDRRDYAFGLLGEITQYVCSQEKYPCLSVCQILVPMCIKALGQESDTDVNVKGRLVDFIARLLSVLNMPPQENQGSDLDAEWVELFEGWSSGQGSFCNVLTNSVLFRNRDKLSTFLLSLCNHDAVNIRLKVIRAISCNISREDQVLEHLKLRLSDSSPAVRDGVLDVFDHSIGVQKKALRLLSLFIKNGGINNEFSVAIAAILNRMTDPCYKILRDEWFIKYLESDSLHGSLMATILDVNTHLLRVDCVKLFVQKALSDFVIDIYHDKIVIFLNGAIDKVIDRLLEAGANKDEDANIPLLLNAVAVFSQANPRLMEPHLCVLKHFAEAKDHRIVETALSLLAQSFQQVSVSSLKSLDGIIELLSRIVLTGNESSVKSAIDCLYIYCSRATGNFELILRLWSKFSKYLKGQLKEPNSPVSFYSRALFSLGCLCRHSGQTEKSATTIPGHVLSAAHLFSQWFKGEVADESTRMYALHSIAMAIESFPLLLLDSIMYELILGLSKTEHVEIILKCVHEVLKLFMEKSNQGSSIAFDPSAANRHTVEPVIAEIIQKYLQFVLECAIIDNMSLAFSANPNESIRLEADKALSYLIEKHPSLVSAQLSKTIMLCYDVCRQQMWTANNDPEQDEPFGPLSNFYEKTCALRKRSTDFAIAITKLICEARDGNFVSWLVQSSSLLRFRHAQEISVLMKGVAQDTALFADSLLDDGGNCKSEGDQLHRFVLLSRFLKHLQRSYGIIIDGSSGVLKAKPKPFMVSHDWAMATREAAYEEAIAIIQEDVIRVTTESMEDSDVSMKSPPIVAVAPTKRNKRQKSTKGSKPRRSKWKSAGATNVEAPSSDTMARKSARSNSQQRVDYFESSEDE